MMANSDNVAFLGLGSNLANELGSPIEQLQQAITRLRDHPEIEVIKTSSFYQSKPMGPQDQPDFVNAVVAISTALAPLDLLAFCQSLEQLAKRQRLRYWGERSLDVDILLYGDQQIQSPTLTVPHAGLLERNFVLVPLKEIAPDLQILQTPITDLAMSADWTGLEQLTI